LIRDPHKKKDAGAKPCRGKKMEENRDKKEMGGGGLINMKKKGGDLRKKE